ncbi:hypothetical protein D0B32_02685 [Paraburkholderia sp. DHOC27]|nr:hypothetical protein D0B32_02685 [Paraburkholderia sp. DHOC27]
MSGCGGRQQSHHATVGDFALFKALDIVKQDAQGVECLGEVGPDSECAAQATLRFGQVASALFDQAEQVVGFRVTGVRGQHDSVTRFSLDNPTGTVRAQRRVEQRVDSCF